MADKGADRQLGRRADGFTLIELLVVIAIIAVVAAILFPAFAQAREKARQTACLSNLRQLGSAVVMYLQDNDGGYPVVRARVASDPPIANDERTASWVEAVYPYIKNGAVIVNGPLSFHTGIFRCPSDAGNGLGPSYGVNAWFEYGLTEAALTHPSETVLLAEKRSSIDDEHFVWWNPPWPGWPLQRGTTIADREAAINAVTSDSDEKESAGLQTLRHALGANWLFADTHTKWGKLAQIWGDATSTNQLWPTR